MDTLDEIRKLIDAKEGSENSVVRRSNHIKWLWVVVSFMLVTGTGWTVAGTLWYSKMERTSRVVEQIYLKIYGNPMP